jgi:hypothetical protein
VQPAHPEVPAGLLLPAPSSNPLEGLVRPDRGHASPSRHTAPHCRNWPHYPPKFNFGFHLGAYAASDLERARAAPPCRAPRRLKRPRPAEGRAHAGCPLPHPFERCAIRVRSGCWISSAWVEFLPALPKAAPANAIQEKRAPKERDDPMVSYPTDGDDSILGTSGPDRINEKSGLADSACQKSPGRDSRRRTRRFRRSSRPTSLVGPLSGDAVQWPRVTRVTRRHRGRLRP